MVIGRAGSLSLPPHSFILFHLCSASHDGEFFFAPSGPLGPREASTYPVKLYLLLICPQLLHFFLIKPISLIKIYLKLHINLFHQIKLIFSKKWIIFWRKCTFNILHFFHFGLYILFLSFLVSKPINAWHLSLYCQLTNRKSWGGWRRELKIILKH